MKEVATEFDNQLHQLREVIERGWPNNTTNLLQQLHEYWKMRGDKQFDFYG